MTDITVVIPTIPERADLLERALKSVEAQTLQPSEVHVVEANPGEGAPSVKQRGLNEVTTEWVAMLDDDDEFREDHLEKLVSFQEEFSADLVYPWFELIDRDGSIVDPQPPLCTITSCLYGGTITASRSAEGIPWNRQLKRMTMTPYGGNVIITGILMRAPFARKVGGYPQPGEKDWPEFPWEELGLWRRMLFEGAVFAHSPERTYRWHRTHGRNTGGRPELRRQHYRWP